MLEHVPDPASVIRACYRRSNPAAVCSFDHQPQPKILSVLAIIGAEYIMKLIPRGTHDFKKFIRPSELGAWSRQAGLSVKDIIGLTYNPLTKKHYKLASDVDVNYDPDPSRGVTHAFKSSSFWTWTAPCSIPRRTLLAICQAMRADRDLPPIGDKLDPR